MPLLTTQESRQSKLFILNRKCGKHLCTERSDSI